MRFTKMHGLGNDFLVLDAIAEPKLASRDDEAQLTRALCDRRLGVGADGVIIMAAPADPHNDASMRIINADGSEARMCGNGLRCLARLLRERRANTPSHSGPIRIETSAGVRSVDIQCDPSGAFLSATVNMGSPDFDPAAIPVRAESLPAPLLRAPFRTTSFPSGTGVSPVSPDTSLVNMEEALSVGDYCQCSIEGWTGVLVSVGNPHLIIFCNDADSVDLAAVGPLLETHKAFPQRINIHIAQITASDALSLRSWERGAGLTSACGTGACAAFAAGVATGRLERDATVKLPGGELQIRWIEPAGELLMTGPATLSFTGDWPDDADLASGRCHTPASHYDGSSRTEMAGPDQRAIS